MTHLHPATLSFSAKCHLAVRKIDRNPELHMTALANRQVL